MSSQKISRTARIIFESTSTKNYFWINISAVFDTISKLALQNCNFSWKRWTAAANSTGFNYSDLIELPWFNFFLSRLPNGRILVCITEKLSLITLVLTKLKIQKTRVICCWLNSFLLNTLVALSNFHCIQNEIFH